MGETIQTARVEGRDTVERGARTRLPDGVEPRCASRPRLPGDDDDGVLAQSDPATGLDLAADCVPVDSDSSEVSSMRHTAVGFGNSSGTGCALGSREPASI